MKREVTCCIITDDFCNFDYLLQNETEKEKIMEKAVSEISKMRKVGVTKFISALEVGIDLFAASYIQTTKKVGESLECALAYEEQANDYSEKEREVYFSLCEKCDTLSFVSRKRIFGCKSKRDRYMIEQSDYILCFWNKIAPYTGPLLQYAAALNKKIVYI